MSTSERNRMLVPRFDLGLRTRAREWRHLLTPHGFGRDLGLELGLSIVTIVTMAPTGVATGLLAGLGLAFGIAAVRMARTRALLQRSTDTQAPHQVLKKGKVPDELTTLESWSEHVRGMVGELSDFSDAEEAARAVTVRQIDNLMSYPLVRAKFERFERCELQIHAWFYDLGEVDLFEWDPTRGKFIELSGEPKSIPPIAV